MPFQAIAPQRLYQQVAGQIGELIRAGQFGPGQRLPPERDLARRLNVSRPVVREAMIALELAGLVEVRMGSGVFVTEPRPSGFSLPRPDSDAGPGPFELIEARHAIEGETAALAARYGTEQEIDNVDNAVEQMIEENARGFSSEAGDRQFHLRLAQATHNSVLLSVVAAIWELRDGFPMWKKLHERVHAPEIRPRWVDDHRAIVQCLRQRDPDNARAAMHRHLAHVRAVLLDATEAEDVAGGSDADASPS